MREGWYDIAQICINGHVINTSVKSSPQHNMKFCNICGSSTITNCQSCKTEIRGKHYEKGIWDLTMKYLLPKFCPNCGIPYPWTAVKIKAAQKLAFELDSLTHDERKFLSESLIDIIRDTPEATKAATRVKKLIDKAGKGIKEAFKNILIDIASEAVKKIIWE